MAAKLAQTGRKVLWVRLELGKLALQVMPAPLAPADPLAPLASPVKTVLA
jgi:hypothetical protein